VCALLTKHNLPRPRGVGRIKNRKREKLLNKAKLEGEGKMTACHINVTQH